MQIEYRIARMEDMGEICRLVVNAVDRMIENDILQWDEFYPTEADFREDISKNNLYVGSVDDRIAVVYAMNQECEDAYKEGKWKHEDIPYYVIHRLCVNPNFQNMGIGRQTLLHIEERLLLIGIKAIRLDVFTKNPYALRLYDGLGYELVGDADWRKGRFCLMEKYLG